ncbi:hypothetical protein ACFQV2_19475 [Actinokineospora soli]|uniref:Phage protein n=1 Tax=Actinokineospora soli TaxID=1048753 RepID=A0ABW2TQ27_9PSEU
MTLTVPYITAWTGERTLPAQVILTPNGQGIRYADETLTDRDHNGILWTRAESRPGLGKPKFGEIHSLRQRRVMRHLLCQVCAGLPDRNNSGVLWLMPDYRGDWPAWPNGMATDDAPVCLPCAHTSVRQCPRLRRDHVLVRSKSHPIVGVRGIKYYVSGMNLTNTQEVTVAQQQAAQNWTVAHQLVRELLQCRVIGTIDDIPQP